MADSMMPDTSLRDEIHRELASIRLIDPHTHINPHQPASTTLADILGYHYYTELAHSAGMPKSEIEADGIAPRELVGRLVERLQPLENTAQHRWLIEICRMFFGFDDDCLHVNNWQALYDQSETVMASAQWPQMVLDQSNVQSVFLTNDFDDELKGFDTDTYIPCLRTDDLVFHLTKPEVRGRLAACTGIALDGSLQSVRASLRQRFEHFVNNGARACAISLPPTFQPTRVSDGRATTALDAVLQHGVTADASHQDALSRRVFWTLAELCDEFGLPFDLMIGVNRGVYAGGVYQGQDLYDSRVSLIQYRELFNAFASVKFPISVLASVTNQELVSYAWIFPNVITNGHWWYSNTPSFIARDAAARLEAVPQTKQIGYYSDAYRLEFVWPKFDMYRRVLAGVLADQFVRDQGWSVERALELGRRVLRDNVDEIFSPPAKLAEPISEQPIGDDPGLALERSEAFGGVAAATSIAADRSEDADVVDWVAEEASPPDPSPTEEEDPFDTKVALEALTRADADAAKIDATADDDLRGSDSESWSLDSEATVIEEPGRVDADDVISDLAKTASLSDLPTVVDRPHGRDASAASPYAPDDDSDYRDREQELDDDPLSDATIDALPNEDEIRNLDIPDVELATSDRSSDTVDDLMSELDPEPLDVGDLSGDPPDIKIEPSPSDALLAPDDDSLQPLDPDGKSND
ncbi:MAG: glucuronate isomerase [Planctomycetota bacterium]